MKNSILHWLGYTKDVYFTDDELSAILDVLTAHYDLATPEGALEINKLRNKILRIIEP